MSEPFGTTEQLDLESIEKRLDAIARPGSWTVSMPTMAEVDRLNLLLAMARLVKKDAPALIACVRELKAENATWQERDDLMNRCERAANDGRAAYAAGTPISDCPYNEPGPDGMTYGDLIETWMLAHRNAEYEAERDAENATLRAGSDELGRVQRVLHDGGITGIGAAFAGDADAVDQVIGELRRRERENATLRRQLGELCPIGDLGTITSLRAEIQLLQEQVARYKPLYDAVHGMRRGMVLLHRSESDRWAVFQIGYPPVNGDTPEAALGLEEGNDE